MVAVSADPVNVSREHVAKMGWTLTVLSDEKNEVARRYDLLHVGGAQGGDVSRPAEILIDPTGTVRWLDLTEDYRVRARPETVLEEFDRLQRTASMFKQ